MSNIRLLVVGSHGRDALGAGVSTVLLEKHADFLRGDFGRHDPPVDTRGDERTRRVEIVPGASASRSYDADGKSRRYAALPSFHSLQIPRVHAAWDFIFLAQEAKRFPEFDLRASTRKLIWENGRAGVRAQTPARHITFRTYEIAADGREIDAPGRKRASTSSSSARWTFFGYG